MAQQSTPLYSQGYCPPVTADPETKPSMGRFSSYLDDMEEEESGRKHIKMDEETHFVPMFISPLPVVAGVPVYSQPWVPEKFRGSGWLALLYDLILVAVLAVFGEGHEIVNGAALLSYVSFFVVIWWIWASQVFYDVRYQTEDNYHRFMKMVQLCIIGFVGAGCQGWNLSILLVKEFVDGQLTVSSEAAKGLTAQEAFKVAIFAFAGTRFLLAVQYLVVYWRGRVVQRATSSIMMVGMATATSGALCFIAAAIKPETHALIAVKIALLYSSILIEAFAEWGILFLKSYVRPPSNLLNERLASFTLVVLGEGVNAMLKSFALAISAFGITDNSTYAQALCALLSVYFLWSFVFSGFNVEQFVGKRRNAIWTSLHLPLHLTTMLWIWAIRNNITALSYASAIDNINGQIILATEAISNGTYPPAGFDDYDFSIKIERLNLNVSWPDEVVILNSSYNNPDDRTDPFIVASQYIINGFVDAASAFSVDTEAPEIKDAIAEISSFNNTYFDDDTERNTTETEFSGKFDNVVQVLIVSACEGTEWMLPTSGILLILVAVMNFVRYEPSRFTLWWHESICLVVGIALSFLGFLNRSSQGLLGSKGFLLLNVGMLLPLVTLVWLGVWILQVIIPVIRRKRAGKLLILKASNTEKKLSASSSY